MRLFFQSACLLLLASLAAAQIPDGPRPQGRVSTPDFFAGEALMWGGIIADGWESSRSINHQHCTGESNPLFARGNGSFQTEKYFALNVAIGGAFTVTDILLRRYAGKRKAVRIFTTAMTASLGAPHWREFSRFYTAPWGCH